MHASEVAVSLERDRELNRGLEAITGPGSTDGTWVQSFHRTE